MAKQVNTKVTKQKPIRILIADDYHFYRYGLRVFLEEQPDLSVVGEAGSSEDTLSSVEELKPHVVLLDLDLPSEGGLHVLRQINARTPQTKVIILTGLDDELCLADAIESGASGYVLKDAEPPLILSAVRSVGRGGTWLQREMTGKLFEDFTRLTRARREAPDRLLTSREVEVLSLVAQGHRNAQIADKLFISERTVKVHITNLFRKLGLNDRVQATRYAIRHRLVRA
ncbi:MAG: response regulator transcription factor [Armatimonadota bacterium]|nr:MAG: response regulator transcription factor [Armatimonadota bacterium]